MKGKDMGKRYPKGKADPGLAPPVLWGGRIPAATELEHPKPIQSRACGMGTGGQNQGGRWLEMHWVDLTYLQEIFHPQQDSSRLTVKKNQEPGCAEAAALRELCQKPGGKGEQELRAGWSWRNIIWEYSETQPCCWFISILLIRDGEQWRRNGSG